MKLKEFLHYLDDDSSVELVDADSKSSWLDDILFYDKILIPKEVLNLDVRKFCGSLYYPDEFDPEDWSDDYDYDPYADVKFYVEGFKNVADKLGLREVVR